MYNLSAVKDIANGDQEFLNSLVTTFITEVPPDAKGLTEAIDNDNTALAHQFAHKLKPNLQSFGIDLDMQFKVIESWSKDTAETASAQSAADNISKVIDRVVLDLKKEYGIH